MARFYSNENIALQVVTELRGLGHDVLTSLDAGKANAAVPDAEVLALAVPKVESYCRTIVATFWNSIDTGLAITLGSLFVLLTRISAGKRCESIRLLRPSPI